jgi:hypothetical protein
MLPEALLDRLRSGFRKKKRRNLIVVMIIVFLILDASLVWYTISYSVEEKEITTLSTEFEIIDIEYSFMGGLLVRGEEEVHRSTQKGMEALQFSGNPVDAVMADESMAVAVLNSTGIIFYYEPGDLLPTFTVEREGAWALLGISEAYTTVGRIPEQIAVLISNSTGHHLEMLSITENGSSFWSYTFSQPVDGYASSDYTAYIAVALGNNSVYHFSRISPSPRQIYHFTDHIDELKLSDSGIKMGVLHSNGTIYSLMTTSSNQSQYDVSLPDDSHRLILKNRAESAFVLSGISVFQVDETGVRERISKQGIVTYTVPIVTDKIFISIPGHIEGFKDNRSTPRWRADLDMTPQTLITDVGGDTLISSDGNSIGIIDDSNMPLGQSILWSALGFLLLGESAFLLIFGLWPRIRAVRRESVYVVFAGTIAGILITALFPEQTTLDWYGNLAIYSMLAAAIAGFSTMATLRVDAGLASVFVGLFVGLVICFPLAMVTHFLLSVAGYEFSGSMVHSMVNTILTGLKMGLLGGAVGYLAPKLR